MPAKTLEPGAYEQSKGACDEAVEIERGAALLKTGALQDAIVKSASVFSIATDEHGVIQIFNVGAEGMLGYTAAEVVGELTPADISDPEEVVARAACLRQEFGTAIAPGFEALIYRASRGIEDVYELTFIRRNGIRVPATVSVNALRDANGVIIGYLLIITDNTARKKAEIDLPLANNQRLCDQDFYSQLIAGTSNGPLLTTDARGVITDVNRQMEILTGYSREELIGSPFRNSFTDPDRAERDIQRAMTEGKVTNVELTTRSRDGKQTILSCNASTFHDRDHNLQGVFASARDITER
ncbi:MAG TPA: PAS domain-containing protein, partial [Bryobacteraceae bacterium]|nr:PAS domain-containing protein [Bryobacteraceae bacterium]